MVNLEVQSCCYFISLRTGAKIFGFISLLGCILASTFTMFYILEFDRLSSRELSFCMLDLLVQSMQMITSVLLIMGAYQERARLVQPWLLTSLVYAAFEVLLLPSTAERFIHLHAYGVIGYIILNGFLLMDDIYGLLVVFSYYRSFSNHPPDSVSWNRE